MFVDGQQLVRTSSSPAAAAAAAAATDLPLLDDSPFKVGRISAEERKEKIHRYMKKRNERNFSKKIKVTILSHRTRNVSDSKLTIQENNHSMHAERLWRTADLVSEGDSQRMRSLGRLQGRAPATMSTMMTKK